MLRWQNAELEGLHLRPVSGDSRRRYNQAIPWHMMGLHRIGRVGHGRNIILPLGGTKDRHEFCPDILSVGTAANLVWFDVVHSFQCV